MEEHNDWLDTEPVKQINQKSVKPVVIVEKKIIVPEQKKSPESKATENKKTPEQNKSPENKNRDKVDEGKEKFGLLNIDKTDIREEKAKMFLDTLVSEFGELPNTSKEWAIKHFGEEWLSLFLRDISYLKSDLISSNFYPSQDKILFLKYIFLLNQSL